MTHLDTLRHMLAVRPCGRHCGCGGCQERAALEEAIRVMEREAAAGMAEPVPAWSSDSGGVVRVGLFVGGHRASIVGGTDVPSARLDAAARLRATARALETP